MSAPIPIPREGNPFHPLPPDYPSLTEEGQREARVNAARQWLLAGTPLERGENLVSSTWFFDQYYLRPDPSASPDSSPPAFRCSGLLGKPHVGGNPRRTFPKIRTQFGADRRQPDKTCIPE